jgi:hypothetical protein
MTTRRFLSSLLLCITLGLLLSPAWSGPQSARPGAGLLPGQTATMLPDGRWLILGGQGAQGPTTAAGIYDAHTGATTTLPTLQPARAWHSATVMPDGTVLVFGGVGPSRTALIPRPDRFSPSRSPAWPRGRSTARRSSQMAAS